MGWNHQLHPEKTTWVFPKIGVSQNGWWKQGNNPIKMDDLGGKPLFSETSTSKLENRPPARGEHQSNFRLFKSTVGSGKPESHGNFSAMSQNSTKTHLGCIKPIKKPDWVVVLNVFYCHPYLGKISNLTNIFQMGWNHQLVENHRIDYLSIGAGFLPSIWM